ncbi:MAG: transcriptional repressor [Opitutaceae bacterium]|nr:transcriptional repressor [Opitutaceae bacterium]
MIASTQTNHPLASIKDDPENSSPLDLACQRLKAAGLRITQPRIAILNALSQRNHPTSIEQIHADLDDGSCDLVTVYRCLAAFEEIGLVQRSFFHNGTSLYQINLGDSARYHVVSKTNGNVEEIDPESVTELQEAVARVEQRLREKGYSDITHVVEFFAHTPVSNRTQAPVSAKL